MDTPRSLDADTHVDVGRFYRKISPKKKEEKTIKNSHEKRERKRKKNNPNPDTICEDVMKDGMVYDM